MTAVKKDLYIEQGSTFRLVFVWAAASPSDPSLAGPPRDLTGWSAHMQIRKNQQSPTIVDASTSNGKIVMGYVPVGLDGTPATPDPANGRIAVILPDEDTDLLTIKSALYDLEVTSPQGDVYRLLEGGVTVSPNITQAPGEPVLS